jgi:hypothetical protein
MSTKQTRKRHIKSICDVDRRCAVSFNANFLIKWLLALLMLCLFISFFTGMKKHVKLSYATSLGPINFSKFWFFMNIISFEAK